MKKRGPNKIKTDYTLKDAYKKYTKEVLPEMQLSREEFMRICEEGNLLVVKEILYNAEDVYLPLLGPISVRKKKMLLTNKDGEVDVSQLRVDWKTTKKLNKVVYHLNQHREGYSYSIRWGKAKCKEKNKSAYSFTPVRNFKRELSKILKHNKEIDYFER